MAEEEDHTRSSSAAPIRLTIDNLALRGFCSRGAFLVEHGRSGSGCTVMRRSDVVVEMGREARSGSRDRRRAGQPLVRSVRRLASAAPRASRRRARVGFVTSHARATRGAGLWRTPYGLQFHKQLHMNSTTSVRLRDLSSSCGQLRTLSALGALIATHDFFFFCALTSSSI